MDSVLKSFFPGVDLSPPKFQVGAFADKRSVIHTKESVHVEMSWLRKYIFKMIFYKNVHFIHVIITYRYSRAIFLEVILFFTLL